MGVDTPQLFRPLPFDVLGTSWQGKRLLKTHKGAI